MDNKRNLQRKPDEENQLLYTLSLIGEILILNLKIIFEFCMSLVRLFTPSTEKSITGEIVLITGTGHGIGRELALQFAAAGATVVCWDINKENNDQTVKDIAEIGYPKAYSYVCDVSNRKQILEMAQKVKKEVGTVSILVNNAGIMPCHLLQEHSEAEIRKIFEINVFAHFWTLEAFLPGMLEKNHGHIVALSSMAGIVGLRNLVPYCASKFAVRGMMEALSEELRETIPNSKIQFTTICPFIVDTGLCKNYKIRFASRMPIVPPKVVAKRIITATKRNIPITSIPGYMLPINNIIRLYPLKVGQIIKDFFDSGVDSDLL